ncbi:hypothetical protein FH5_04536 [Priestia endophytica]|nr:hypothetical protein FH5_04536 [Priestia endophytica]
MSCKLSGVLSNHLKRKEQLPAALFDDEKSNHFTAISSYNHKEK